MSSPLEPVWNSYLVVRDCMRVTTRVLEKDIHDAITEKHRFFGPPTPNSLEEIKQARNELENLTIVSLVAVFERTLRDYLTARVRPTSPATDPLDLAVQELIVNDVEFWPIAQRLIDEVFKHRVDPDLCGMVKQIIDYRNEVAHGHVRGSPPPGFADPATTYKRLNDFLSAAGAISP